MILIKMMEEREIGEGVEGDFVMVAVEEVVEAILGVSVN